MSHQRNMMRMIALMIGGLMLTLAFGLVSAQDVPPGVEITPIVPGNVPPVQVPILTVERFEPTSMVAGIETRLTILGSGFTASTLVRLEGFGLLNTTYVNPTLITAVVPSTLGVGQYPLIVSDPANGAVRFEATYLYVLAPLPETATPTLPPTQAPPPTATDAPTPIPGQPSLIVRNFSANPATILPGGSTTLTFELVNQGSRPALGVSVAVETGGKFAPANGQAGVLLPDIPVGAGVSVTLAVTAAMDTPAGPAAIPLALAFRDFEGQSYTSKATLSVNIRETLQASQVTMARYQLDPNPVIPGQRVTVTVLVQNTGTQTARQVLLRLAGEGVLLAGPQGDSFPVGDIEPGASASVEVPMVVRGDAKAGPQPQTLTISHLQGGESKETSSSITIDVAEVIAPQPQLLLDSYDIGTEVLKPGDRFMMEMTLRNVGQASANNLLVTFGTVDSTNPPGDDDNNGGGNGSGSGSGGSSTNTTPSTTFAPLGGGGTLYIGTLSGEGEAVVVTQEFIVNGTVSSGIYSLPITLRYEEPSGDSAQESLRASLVVLSPPRLRFEPQNPMPPMLNVGEPMPLMLDITNNGKNDVDFLSASFTAENAEILDGAEILLEPLDADDDTSISGTIMPTAPGPVKVTLTLYYNNDLNQPAELVFTYEGEAVEPPPLPEFEPPPIDINVPQPTEEPPQQDWLGRFLLGFLGLGS